MLSLPPKRFFFRFALIVFWVLNGNAYAAVTLRVTVDSNGAQANGFSYQPSVSADGRYIAYASDAPNLVAGDTNFADDIFVYDRKTKSTTRVSIDSNGNQQNGFSSNPCISADGRYVGFVSYASNLVVGDTNDASDIFVHDLKTHQTTLVSVNSTRMQGNEGSYHPMISANGRYVVFESSADNLVANDTNMNTDVFVHDRINNNTSRISLNSRAAQADGGSFFPKISSDGRYVAFVSDAPNLVTGDTNNATDSFVHDRKTKQTTRVSINSKGKQQNSDSTDLSISANGRYVAFESFADNLVDGDTNTNFDSFVHDRITGITTRISVASNQAQGDQDSVAPRLSDDGRFVLFESRARTLITGDTNNTLDVFVHDRQTKRTNLVSVGSKSTQGNEVSLAGSINSNGSIVAFQSYADNLVDNDTNANMDVFLSDRTLDVAGHADLQITVNQQPKELARDTNGTYSYTVTNKGPDSVSEVGLVYLASGGDDIRFAPNQGTCKQLHILSYTTGLCSMGKLKSGNSLKLTVDAKVHHESLFQKLTISSKLIDKVLSNNTVSISTLVKK